MFARDLGARQKIVEQGLVGGVEPLQFAQAHGDAIVLAGLSGDLVETGLQGVFARLGDVKIILQIDQNALNLGGNGALDVAPLRSRVDDQRMLVAIMGGEIGFLARDLGLLRAQ